MLKIALLFNFIIIFCEIYTLWHIKNKIDILKYYTYLQNLLALISSLVFSIYLTLCMVSGIEIHPFVRGLRYVATCGLTATTFMFVVFLGTGKKASMTKEDFVSGFSPKVANAILHYICPILSLISFVLFERELTLSNGIWTSICAIPSCLYWMVYIILSAAKLWKEPYEFGSQEGKSNAKEILTYILIPFSFIAISFVLWIVR